MLAGAREAGAETREEAEQIILAMGVTLLETRISSSSPESGEGGTSVGGPRQQWLDITFPNAPVLLSYIAFHNYYTAAITISHTVVRSDDSTRAPQWQVVVPKFTLMADPHCEDDAERYHELKHGIHLASEFDHRRVTRLRICCLQPSPLWREYGLRQLRFYSVEVPLIPSLQPPPSLTPAERDMASSAVEQLVGLGVVASQIRTTIAGGVAAVNTMREATRSVFDGGSIGSAAVGGGTSSSVSGGGAASRRTEPTLAPYIIGEWNDEWRLTNADVVSPAFQPRAPSSKIGSGLGSRTGVR